MPSGVPHRQGKCACWTWAPEGETRSRPIASWAASLNQTFVLPSPSSETCIWIGSRGVGLGHRRGRERRRALRIARRQLEERDALARPVLDLRRVDARDRVAERQRRPDDPVRVDLDVVRRQRHRGVQAGRAREHEPLDGRVGEARAGVQAADHVDALEGHPVLAVLALRDVQRLVAVAREPQRLAQRAALELDDAGALAAQQRVADHEAERAGRRGDGERRGRARGELRGVERAVVELAPVDGAERLAAALHLVDRDGARRGRRRCAARR